MVKNLRAKMFTTLFVVLIVGILAFMYFMATWLQGESISCLKDPIKYVSEKSGSSCYTYCIDTFK